MSQNVALGKKFLLALSLARGKSVIDAAHEIECSPRTVQRYLRKPSFRALVSRFRGELIAEALGDMAGHMKRASQAFVSLLDHEDAKVRMRAARAVLTLGLRLRDSVELGDQVDRIEQEVARKLGGPT